MALNIIHTVLHQEDVYLKTENSLYFSKGELDVILNGKFVYISWMPYTGKKSCIYQAIPEGNSGYSYIKMNMDSFIHDSHSDENYSSPIFSEKWDYIYNMTGSLALLIRECNTVKIVKNGKRFSFATNIHIDDLFFNISYIKFIYKDKKEAVNLCYLDDPQGIQNLYGILHNYLYVYCTNEASNIYKLARSREYEYTPTLKNAMRADYLVEKFSGAIKSLFHSSEHLSDSEDSLPDKYSSSLLHNLKIDISPFYSLVDKGNKIGRIRWAQYFDHTGRMVGITEFKKDVMRYGIESELKILAYKYIHQYFTDNMTEAERQQVEFEKIEEYKQLRDKFREKKTKSEFQSSRLADTINQIHLDVMRQSLGSYAMNENSIEQKLSMEEIMAVYFFKNEEKNYDQYMADMFTPFYKLAKDDHDSFWLFNFFIESNYARLDMLHSDYLYKSVNNTLSIIKFLFPKFYYSVENFEFMLNAKTFEKFQMDFKRDYSLEDILRLWEFLWTQDITPNYNVFMCVRILMKALAQTDYTEVMSSQFIENLNKNLSFDVENVIMETNALIEYFSRSHNTPKFITKLLS